MGWTASYQLLRDRPLDDGELAALADYIEQHNQPPWEGEGFGVAVTREARADRVIADGWQKLPMATDSEDLERLCQVLNGLPALLPGVEVRIVDDFGAFGWDAAAGHVTTGDDPGPAPLDLTREARATFAAPGSLIPPRLRRLPDALATWLAGSGAPTRAQVRVALVELVTMPEAHPARAELLARLGRVRPRRLAKAGLEVYTAIARSSVAWGAAKVGLERLEDPADVVEEFLEVWRNPRGIYWYGDMSFPDALLDGLARQPAVAQQLEADVAAALAGAPAELDHRRAEHAAQLLGRARSAPALATLIAGARATRGHKLSSDLTYHTVPGLHEGLARAAVPAVAPTLMLELGTAPRAWRHHARAVTALARIAPERASPLLAAVADAGVLGWELVPALQAIGDDRARAALARLCAHPEPRERERPQQALRALGVEPPADASVPPPEALIAHPWAQVREHAMRALDEAADLSRLAGLAIAVALDRALRRREGDDTGRGWRLLERLPAKVQRASLDQQLAWLAGDSARELPAQVLWPEAEAVLALGVDEAAARVPRLWPRLDAATEAALIAEEGAVLAALRAGTLAPDAPLAGVVPRPAPIALVPAEQPAPPPIATSAEPAPAADPAAASAALDGLIDELIEVMAKEQPPSPELVARAGLDPAVLRLDNWDRARALRTRLAALGAARVGQRLLALLPALHELSHLSALAELVLPATMATAGAGAQVARLWDDAFSRPWAWPTRATDAFTTVATTPELLAGLLDEIGAPDDGRLRERTRSAFDLLGAATDQRDLVTAALVARAHADRGRPDEQVGWREHTCRALRKLGERGTLPTAILELAGPGGTARRREDLLELLGRGGAREAAILVQAIDLPDLAVPAVKALGRSGLASLEPRDAHLAHPYWKIRLAAADSNRAYADGKIETYAVWAAIDAAGLAIPDDDRRNARSDRDLAGATWAELAAAYGPPITLSPLPPAATGADATCADHRAWALWALDERAEPVDAVVRVLADELDRALAARGHARHGARWGRWRTKLPELPTDRAGRLAWARARGPAGLSPGLAVILDQGVDGAAVVAAELPGPLLTLSAELRAELEALEAPLAERGRALLAT